MDNIRSLAAEAGLSLMALARRFKIPYRTVQDWAAGKRTPPDYVLRMIREILGVEAHKAE